MHRFRKKSDSGSQAPSLTLSFASESLSEQGDTPLLTLSNDFRTSLILPDLSRRFSLLRSSSGDPVALDVLRNRLAEQRARGAENHISEEEEEMILSSLRFRSRPATGTHGSSEGLSGSGTDSASVRNSHQSANTSESSLTPSASSSPRATKRYSNNLFGSGKFRDYTYMRSVTKATKTQSLTPTESSQLTTDSLRPVTPESSVVSSSAHSSPSLYGDQVMSVAEYRLTKTLGPAGLKRASMALEEVIKEIEEAEDEIVMPRSTPITRNTELPASPVEPQRISQASFEAPMAISSDNRVQSPDVTEQRASPVPSRILPGYIPGMPRPMTPRDSDPDDLRSHSTTPRATSPYGPGIADTLTLPLPANTSPGRPRRDSTSSQRSPTAPLFLQRSTNGRFTPDDRRPASPLSSPPLQAISTSRPGTPSNVVWTVPKSSQKRSSHTKNGGWASDGGVNSSESPGRRTPGVWSPSLSDSPTTSNEPAATDFIGASPVERNNTSAGDRPSSRMSESELAPSARVQRSPTPTQNHSRSPTSPTFSEFTSPSKSTKRSSKQNASSNLFNLGPVPPLIFSPLANSSRSSLESEGSSYHTWEGEEKDRSLSLLMDFDVTKPTWHDLSGSGDSSTPGESADDEWDPEEYIARYAGLKKSDFQAIHDKLVSTSIAREDRPERAASSMRRRRPSTSQSNYSTNGREHRVTGQAPSSPTTKSPPAVVTEKPAPVSEAPDLTPPSPKTLRNRDLAAALFGKDDSDQDVSPSPPKTNRLSPSEAPAKAAMPTPPVSPYQTLRNPSMPKLPHSPQEEAKLAQEVQQRMEAATLALKSPTMNSSTDPYATISRSGTTSRKHIHPNQISNPRLVSASTSVEAVPIVRPPSISSSSPSKIGSRFKKLRGTLRAKNTPLANEDIAYTLPYSSPSPVQMANYDPAKLKPPGALMPGSATETRFKVSVPSPPASAGPGLKGFMARLRGKPRALDNSSQTELSQSHQSPGRPSPVLASISPQIPSPSIRVTEFAPSPPETPNIPSAPPPISSPEPLSASPTEADDPILKQLYEAANKMGIDQGELNALLARKGSTSSKHLLSKAESLKRADTPDASRSTPVGRPSIDEQSMRAVTPENGRLTPANQAPRERPASRQHSRGQGTRRPQREGQAEGRAASAIIRRTIIFPDSKMTADELSVLMGKPLSRRRGSVTSASGRSIHDRAPTPPPPRSPTSKRFSNGPSPPVPSLPSGLAVPTDGAGEKLNSAYESLFDMYAGESRTPGAVPNESDAHNDTAQIPESGAGVEVIQLANGETIWSIVNGLRDDEEESVYNGRASFTSEYSGEGGVQVFFKERGHGRSASKSSMSSFVSRKKSGKRPETKVFYSPSSNIGRLIEELSQGLDSGSFNFMPNRPPGHSPSSSLSTNDMTWTLEERLDEMIQTVKAS